MGEEDTPPNSDEFVRIQQNHQAENGEEESNGGGRGVAGATAPMMGGGGCRKGSRGMMDERQLRAAIKSILAGDKTPPQGDEEERGGGGAGGAETDSSTSSSLSSHTSTLKSGSLAAELRQDKLLGRYPPGGPQLCLNAEGSTLPEGASRMPMDGAVEKTPRIGHKTAPEAAGSIVSRTPKDFFFINVLGEGSFSTVYYAKEVDTGDNYAIKVLLKSEIRREGKVRYVLREKDIMAALTYAHGGHPFVIRLYCTFQDNDRLYFALAYAKHGELLDWLRRLGSFDEAATLFYASEILCALEFLHRCKVIHRDLKPENILVGADWHIMISDFGTAKIIEDRPKAESVDALSPPRPLAIDPLPPGEVPGVVPAVAVKPAKRTVRSSFVGTAHYISPEVLKSEDVGPECDYWALGAIIFQMISGQPPFRAVNEYKILKKILNLDFHFPDGFPEVARDLVSRLLVYKPAERLGSQQTGGIDALKGHPFFKGVDWSTILTRQPPELKPYLPASTGEPAFYGEYQLPPDGPMDFEPGLNEAALSRLMGLGGSGGGGGGFAEIDFNRMMDNGDPFSLCSSPSTSTSSSCHSLPSGPVSIPSAEELERRRLAKLDRQRQEHKYHRFVENNLILKAGLIDKKKGLFARRRMFLLTEGPHLYYVDPVTMHLKGEVPFSEQMRTEAKNFRTFFVHTPKRTYYLFDPERHAKDWCDAIDWAREKYYCQGQHKMEEGQGREQGQGPGTPPSARAKTPTPDENDADAGGHRYSGGAGGASKMPEGTTAQSPRRGKATAAGNNNVAKMEMAKGGGGGGRGLIRRAAKGVKS